MVIKVRKWFANGNSVVCDLNWFSVFSRTGAVSVFLGY